MKHIIYLDYAAATPVDPSVADVMKTYLTERFYNPSASYLAAKEVAKDLQTARETVAQTIGARPIEITFTAGGTEANNLAISGVLRAFPGSKVLVTAIEHDSVIAVAGEYQNEVIPVNAQGMIDIAALQAAIDDTTVLISVMYANNEIGTIEPIRDITSAVAEIRAERKARGIELPLYVHTDAAQASNYLDIHVSKLGVDLMTLNGGKIYGPKASGALYIRSGVRLMPLIHGGGQEHGLRSGTENVAGAIGFSMALKLAQEKRGEEARRLQDLQRYFFDQINKIFPSAIINGSVKKRLPNNVHVTFPGQDNERLLYSLDEQGILAAAGSACSASSDEPSHVLRAIGLTDDEARASLRFTMGRQTSREQIDTVISTLTAILAQ